MLPDISAQLVYAGASTAVPLDAWALSRRIKEAFDPAAVLEHAQLTAQRRAGADPVGGLRAPRGRRPAPVYLHDSGVSVVFEATRMVRGSITDDVLERLAGPMPHAPRKRLTLLLPAGAGRPGGRGGRPRRQGRDQPGRPAQGTGARPRRRHSAPRPNARRPRRPPAPAWSTCPCSSRSPPTPPPVRTSRKPPPPSPGPAGRHFRLTRVDGGHAAAFAIGLGIGLDPWSLAVVPASLREHL